MRTFMSRWLMLLIFLLLLSGLLIALIPTLANTDWGRKQVVYWINRSIPGNVEIRHLNLHWGKGQEIKGFLLKDPEGQAVLEIEKFSTEGTLWQLLNKSTHLGFTQIQDLNAVIVTSERGLTNLQRALGIESNHESLPLSPSTIILSEVNAEGHLFSAHHPLSARIKGLTRQENLNGSFDIDLALNGLQASNWDEFKHDAHHYLSIEGSKEAKIQAHIVNFPVDLIDRLAALQNPQLNGLFHSLLGDRLNLNLDKEPSDEGLAFNLTLLAPLMQGDMKGIIKQQVLALNEPAVLHFNLTPNSINPFLQNHLRLLKPSRLEVVISTLSVPLDFFDKEATINPCLLGFKAGFKLPETYLDVNPIGDLKILTLQANLHSGLCDKSIQMEVIGQAQQSGAPFDIHFTSTLNKSRNFSELILQARQSMRSNLTISHLSLRLIPFFHKHPEWDEKIGPYVNAQFEMYPKDQEQWIGTLSFQTPHLVLNEAQFNIQKEMILTSPAQMNWSLSSDCLRTLLNAEEFALDQACLVQFSLKQLQIPLDDPQLTKFQIESSIPHLDLPKLLTWGIPQVNKFFLKIEGDNLRQFHSELTGQITLLTPEGKASPFIPEPLTFQQVSDWKLGNEGLEMPSGEIQLNNSITHVQIEGQLHADYVLELTQPAQIQYVLSPSAFQTLSHLLQKNWPILKEEVPATLTIQPTNLNLNELSFSNLSLQGLLKTKRIILQDTSDNLPLLEDIIMSWVIDSPNNNIYSDLKGLAYTRKEAKPSQVNAYLQFWLTPGHYDAAHTRSEIQMNFAGMPTSMLNTFLGTDDLSPVVGSIIDFDFKTFIDPTLEKPGYWDLTLDSTNFHVNGRFKLDGRATIYDLNKLPAFRLTVTPEGYQYLKKIFSFQDERNLSAPVTIMGSFSKFEFPIRESWKDQGMFDLHLSTTDIQWQNVSTPAWKLEGRISTENLMKRLNFFAQAHAKMPLILEGSLTNVFDHNSRLRNWQEVGLSTKLTGQQLTPAFVQSLLPLTSDQQQKLRAIFGENFDLTVAFQLQNLTGPLQALAKGTQGYIQLDGQLNKGILTLNKPIEGAVEMTPLFSQTFLAPNVPLLSTAIGAENPITFTIEPSQFSCPLIPFQFERMRIGKGNLNLGKIRFRNEGELNAILNLIRPLSDQSLTIWFTPLYFELNRGIFSLKRMDMLVAHSYTLANHGTINLKTHQADFILGIPGQTLQYAFGIQGLDENYILQIPLHSANGKVEVDKKKAMTRISALVAQTHGGTKGKLLGNILNMTLSEKGKPYPSPTTQPLPWQEEFYPSPQQEASSPDSSNSSPSQDKEEGKNKKKKRKHLDSDHPTDLQEGAIQLLDQWLSQP